jgi:DNA-binding GntR family transcriptional regulator
MHRTLRRSVTSAGSGTLAAGFRRLRAEKSRPSLADDAYQAIKARILSLELRPGLFINEQTLSDVIGIGRMPVHQAVHRLKTEGLLDVIARKGIVIRATSLNELRALLEARGAVEPSIAALAAERADARQIKAMRRLLAQSRAHLDQQRDRHRFMELDRAFHQAVAEAAANTVLAEAQRPLHERSVRVWMVRVWAPDGLKMTQYEHERILEGIADHDPAAARSAMTEHLDKLRARIIEGITLNDKLVPAIWEG